METGLILTSPVPAIIERDETPQRTLELPPLLIKPVRIIEILNPFRVEERKVTELEPLENESLASIVIRAGMRPEDHECSLNGEPVPVSEIWSTAVKPGWEIVLFPHVGGGALPIIGGVLMALAFVALCALYPPLLAMSTTMFNVILGGCFLGGTMLTAWALAPGQPSPPSYSSSYDPTGPKGLAQPGGPVPKGYGTMGWCGNIISSYVSFAGQKAYINVLVCYGFGQAAAINNILVNDQPISNFADCSYQTRLGTNNQSAIDGFDRTVNGYPQGMEMLVANGPITVSGTGTDVQGLEITVKFPSGLYCVTGDGNYVTCHFIYQIQVAPHGTNAWVSPLFPNMADTSTVASFHNGGQTETWPAWVVIPTDRFAGSGLVYASDNGSHNPGDPWSSTESVTVVNMDGSHGSTSVTFQGVWQPCDPNTNPVKCNSWFEGYIHVQNYITSAFYDTECIYGLTPGQWDVQVTKICYYQDQHSPQYWDSTKSTQIADGWLWNINEITLSNLAYPNMVLVGVKALATGQMSGSGLQVMATITHDIGADTVLPPALAGYEHDNPAIVAYDVLTNQLYGMGVLASNIDVPAFAAWAAFNDELVTNQDGSHSRRHIFAGVFDQSSDAWKTLQTIGTMSRATVTSLGMRYSVVIDAPADPVQLFTVGNTKKDSFQEMWLALDDRSTLIECDFSDAARNYRMDLPVSVMTEADMNSGLQPKTTRTKLIGCTSRDQAWRWSYHQLLSTKLTLRTIQITAPIEAICCKYGSVIAVQSDVTQWAAGGRVQPGSTLATLNVERTDLAFASGAGWTVSVQHPIIERGTGTISSIAGLNVNLIAPLPSGRILKMVGSDGTEYVVTGYGGSAVTLASATGIATSVPLAAGQTVTFYDMNVIDVLNVSNVVTTPASGAVITVSSNFSAVPSTDSSWAYGQSAGYQPAKLFRVVSIKKSGDFSFEIGALEYNAEIYTDMTPNYGEIVGVPDSSPAITGLTLTEQFQNGTLTGSANSAIIAVGWQNGNTAVGAKVQVQAAGGPWNTIGNIQGQGCTFVGTIGVTYTVQVTGFDWQTNIVGSPATASITVVASSNAPANVQGFTGYSTSSETVLAWTANSPAPDHYEIRYSSNGAANWTTAEVLWDGSGTTWTDTTLRPGLYMIVAVSSLTTGSVTSVTPATFENPNIYAPTLLLGTPGTPTIATNVSGYTAYTTLQANLSAQNVLATDGTILNIAAQSLLWTGLTPSTRYYLYLYLDSSLTLQAVVSPGSTPDTAPNAANSAAAASAGLYYWVIAANTGSGSGGGGSMGGGGGARKSGSGPNTN